MGHHTKKQNIPGHLHLHLYKLHYHARKALTNEREGERERARTRGVLDARGVFVCKPSWKKTALGAALGKFDLLLRMRLLLCLPGSDCHVRKKYINIRWPCLAAWDHVCSMCGILGKQLQHRQTIAA